MLTGVSFRQKSISCTGFYRLPETLRGDLVQCAIFPHTVNGMVAHLFDLKRSNIYGFQGFRNY